MFTTVFDSKMLLIKKKIKKTNDLKNNTITLRQL